MHTKQISKMILEDLSYYLAIEFCEYLCERGLDAKVKFRRWSDHYEYNIRIKHSTTMHVPISVKYETLFLRVDENLNHTSVLLADPKAFGKSYNHIMDIFHDHLVDMITGKYAPT